MAFEFIQMFQSPYVYSFLFIILLISDALSEEEKDGSGKKTQFLTPPDWYKLLLLEWCISHFKIQFKFIYFKQENIRLV